MEDTRHFSGRPFVEPSLRGALDLVRETIATQPLFALQVVGGLAAITAFVTVLDQWIDVSGAVSGMAVGAVAGMLVAYTVPRMWSTRLGLAVDAEVLKAAMNKLTEPTFGAAAMAAFIAGIGVAPLLLLVFIGGDLDAPVFVGVFAIGALFAIRLCMVALVLVPAAVIEEKGKSSTLTGRAWQLSRKDFGTLAKITLVVAAVFVGLVGLSLWLSSLFTYPLWVDEYLLVPLVAGLFNGFVVFVAPAAYAISRHGEGGYGEAEARGDLDQMLAPTPDVELQPEPDDS